MSYCFEYVFAMPTCLLQPVLAEAVDYFFGDAARVPASTNMHDRLMDLLLTALTFSMEDPGMITASDPRKRIQSLTCLLIACGWSCRHACWRVVRLAPRSF